MFNKKVYKKLASHREFILDLDERLCTLERKIDLLGEEVGIEFLFSDTSMFDSVVIRELPSKKKSKK